MSNRLNPNSSMFIPTMPPQLGNRGQFPFMINNPNVVIGHHPHSGYNNIYPPYQQQQILMQQQQQQHHSSSSSFSTTSPTSSNISSKDSSSSKDKDSSKDSSSSSSKDSSSSSKDSSSSSKDSSSSSKDSSKDSSSKDSSKETKTNTPYSTQFKNLADATKYFSECTFREFTGHKKKVNSVAWSCDGKRLASGGLDQIVKIWTLNDPKSKEIELKGHTDNIEQLKWSPVHSDTLATASSDKTVRIWDVRSGKCTTVINTPGENINLCWHPSGTMIAVGNKEDVISFIDLKKTDGGTDQMIVKTYKYTNEVNEIAWDSKGELFFLTCGTGILEVMAWISDSKKYLPLKSINAHTSNLYTFEVDPLGRYFAIGAADAVITLWDSQELFCVRSFTKLNQPVRATSFSSDGQFLAYSSEEPLIEIGHIETGQSIFQVNIDTGLNSIAWHPTLPLIAFSGDDKESSKDNGTVRVFGKFNS